jgi:hypothetical protein
MVGKGPHNPKDTSDNTFKFESFVRVVKKASIEKLSDKVFCFGLLGDAEELLLFPTTVNSVT